MEKTTEELIISHLEANKSSVTVLAKEMGMSQPHLWMVLCGSTEYKRPLSKTLLAKINEHLGTDFKKQP